jgi:hypothetical protein
LSNENDQTLLLSMLSSNLNPQTKALSEGSLAALSFLNSGNDLLVSNGMEKAVQAGLEDPSKTNLFVAGSLGKWSADTGSNVDVRGGNLIIGAARTRVTGTDNLTAGLFYETGWSGYDTYNNFDDAASIVGHGHAHYDGIGVLTRLDKQSGTYVEGSFHAGHLTNKFNAPDLIDYNGNAASYDLGSPYYSLFLGLGHIHKLTDRTSVDVYGKYMFSYVPSRGADISGDHFTLDSVTSNRIRVGARWQKTVGRDNGAFYVGLAGEHEFSGSQNGRVLAYDLAAPSLKGTTGLLEVGWHRTVDAKTPFGLDIGLTGRTGELRGITGNVELNWKW